MSAKEKVKQPPLETHDSPQLPVAYRRPALAPMPDSTPEDWPTNFDLTTGAGKAGLLNAGNPPEWCPQDGGEYMILATHYLCMPDEVVDEQTGELRQFTRTVFVDADGRNVKLSSDHAPRRLHAMLSLYSAEEWERGIPIQCYTGISRRGGRRYGSFRIINIAPKE